ncbi:MAG: peptidoglycan-binding protein [bacterium]|nr:peptidoglycan-binding protein [bacterium]
MGLGFTQEATTRKLDEGVGDGSPLAAYQKSRGLAVTGKFDEDTLYAITDPQEWRVIEEK